MMKGMIWLLAVMGLLVVTAVVWAQDEDRPIRIGLEPVGADGSAVPFTINAGGATCAQAATLTLPGGDSTNVSEAGISSDDPVLACMWGNPERAQGYRTVWYKFVPPHNGHVTVSTFNSQYDTVLAVYSGTCTALPNSLNPLACNDDTVGFSSQVSLNVSKGQTYYVEVADWHQAVDDPTLNISVLLDPLDSNWEQMDLMAVPLSRHTAVVPGDNIFVLGGQDDNVFTGSPSRRLFRYNTVLDTWDELASMPGETGYAHAAAVFYQGRMYVPGGVVNSYYDASDQLNQDVDDTHWVYTPVTGGPGSWQTRATPAWPNGSPWTWTATVASADPQKLGYYLIGGLSSAIPLVVGADVRSEVLFYSTFSHDWHNQPPMEVNGTAVPRYGHTAVWLAGRVCVTGGLDGSAQLLPQGVCFNPDTETWSYIAAMNQPRYGASSAVGPDGRWYVFGGFDDNGAVATTEVYDPQLNTWISLNVPFDLGGGQSLPARGWLQVAWANDHFWAIGGEQTGTTNDSVPLPLVEKLFIPSETLFLPFTIKPNDGSDNRYDNFAQAQGLALNVVQEHNFEGFLDFVDVFYFNLPSMRQVRVLLTQIPQNNNYDIAIYSHNKLLWGKGENLSGQDEDVTLTLPPGLYYILVERKFPISKPDPDDTYHIKVEG